jgi:hypothetical protein
LVQGSVVISGLPASFAGFNATYQPTGSQVGGHPAYTILAGAQRVRTGTAVLRETLLGGDHSEAHLFHHPVTNKWHICCTPFDPAAPHAAFLSTIGHSSRTVDAAAGPLPTGTRTWRVMDMDRATFVDAEVTVRETAGARENGWHQFWSEEDGRPFWTSPYGVSTWDKPSHYA